jgi:hypothetical protein
MLFREIKSTYFFTKALKVHNFFTKIESRIYSMIKSAYCLNETKSAYFFAR